MPSKKPEFPRKGKTVGSWQATVTGICEVELPEGARMALGEHGTTRRYGQMVKLGASACQACRTANTQRDLAYRYRKGLLKGKPKDGAVVDLLSKMEAKSAAKKPAARRAAAKKASSSG